MCTLNPRCSNMEWLVLIITPLMITLLLEICTPRPSHFHPLISLFFIYWYYHSCHTHSLTLTHFRWSNGMRCYRNEGHGLFVVVFSCPLFLKCFANRVDSGYCCFINFSILLPPPFTIKLFHNPQGRSPLWAENGYTEPVTRFGATPIPHDTSFITDDPYDGQSWRSYEIFVFRLWVRTEAHSVFQFYLTMCHIVSSGCYGQPQWQEGMKRLSD